MAWLGNFAALKAAAMTPSGATKPPKRRGRPPIHLSAGLNLVMPSQFYSDTLSAASLPGEKRLMFAVLSDAISIVLKHAAARDARGRRLFVETLAWINADDDAWPFSFVNVCDALGIEPSWLRRGLQRCRERQEPDRCAG